MPGSGASLVDNGHSLVSWLHVSGLCPACFCPRLADMRALNLQLLLEVRVVLATAPLTLHLADSRIEPWLLEAFVNICGAAEKRGSPCIHGPLPLQVGRLNF